MSDSADSGNVGKFEPKKLTSGAIEIKAFTPRSLNGSGINEYSEVKRKFGSLSNLGQDSDSPFNLHPASKKFLGVEKEEKNHVEELVRTEVEFRLSSIRDEAYREGYELGRKEGSSSAQEEYRAEVRPIQNQLNLLMEGFDSIKKDLYQANEAFLIQLVFQVAKQVLLKDLSTDRDYVKRLAAQVIEKLGAKENIRLKISKADAANLESIKEFLKSEIPDLKNIQIEASEEIQLGGCKVETDLSRINASIENQLQSIQKALGEK